jgi:K+-sensing histidine kinase KdpD
MGHCHGEAATSVLAKVRGNVFARFHAVATKRRSRTRNSQFGLLGPVRCTTTTAVWMVAAVRNILDTASYCLMWLLKVLTCDAASTRVPVCTSSCVKIFVTHHK